MTGCTCVDSCIRWCCTSGRYIVGTVVLIALVIFGIDQYEKWHERKQARAVAERIRDAAAIGDVAALTALSDEMRREDAAMSAYADRVRELVDGFEFDRLGALADEIESSVQSTE